MGIFRKNTLHFVDRYCYDNIGIYDSDEHNKSSLWSWEQKAVDKYFEEHTSILVVAAGGGREVLALRKAGYDADGVECNKNLCAYANELLKKEGLDPDIKLVPRDRCPDIDKIYDGFIIGYNAYTLIQGKKQRIALLRQLYKHSRPGAPVLLSFYTRTENERRFNIIVSIANIIRWLSRKHPAEPGDNLFPLQVDSAQGRKCYLPYYVHHFTREEIASELIKGGFNLISFSTDEYGHAVGIASGPEE